MKEAKLVITASLLLMAAASMATADPKPDPREELKTAIPEAIRLLEDKAYVDLLKKFVAPDDLKMLTKKQPIEEFAKEFGESKAKALLKALKSTKDVEPTLSDDKKKAVFKLKEEIVDGGGKTISFAKVDKYWYIEN
ncbi:MAG: hypothetical protein JWM11_2686 [Planctomycetaceae bacterium]|nr:hypothetical protein [Planctomycetaceae bacterium]